MKVYPQGLVWISLAILMIQVPGTLHAGLVDYGYDSAGRLVHVDNIDDVNRTYFNYDETGNVTSVAIVLAPIITSGPMDLEVMAGETASFSVSVDGSGMITYQWSKDGQILANASLAELILANARNADAGDYTVLVSNEVASVESSPASLTVTGGSGDPVLTAPFENAEYLGERTFDTWMGPAYLPEGEVTEIYLRDQGWISIGLALGDGGMWYWDYAMVEWVYSNPVFYPNIYLPSLEWLLYWDPFSNTETRWFYRYADDDYYSWPRYPGPLPYE